MNQNIYNFSAGPSVLPKEATKQAAEAVLNFANTGVGILEMSHRTPPIENMVAQTDSLLRELLQIPDSYEILFLGGGASLQFSMAPLNLCSSDDTVDYTDTGVWAAKAIKEAKQLAHVNVVSSSKESIYSYIPKDFNQSAKATYLHVTSNNTIYGTQWKTFPKANTYLVSDMSSDILSRKINVSDFGLIYAGAQKNMSCAGVTVVIVRKDILGKTNRIVPTMLQYQTHIEAKSMFNTPPVFPIYVMNRTLNWLQENGGVENIEKINIEKSNLLYEALDQSKLFMGTAAKEDRSTMNVPFVFNKENVSENQIQSLEKDFLNFTTERGLVQLKGHRSVGGFRASIYNAMPIDGIKALVQALEDFEKKVI